MRVSAIVKRIIRQIIRDKRTLALMIFAPILILSLLYLVLNTEDYVPKIGFVHIPAEIEKHVALEDANVSLYDNELTATEDLKSRHIDGYVLFGEATPSVTLEGTDPTINRAVIEFIQSILQPVPSMQLQTNKIEVSYLYGTKEMGQFDFFGPVLLGFFAFFFVFLIAGVSFLRERTTGTLERVLSSPLRKWEIVIGYVVGFGLFTMIQATIIAAYSIYVLNMAMEGSFIYVLLITLLLSLTALTLGILLSAFANNELQMMQFIPLVIVPQFFFTGLFNLETMSPWLSWIGPLTPLYYGADALRHVMIRGYGWEYIYVDLLVLTGFSVVFIVLNIFALNKYRKI